jgi:hypothetical protein
VDIVTSCLPNARESCTDIVAFAAGLRWAAGGPDDGAVDLLAPARDHDRAHAVRGFRRSVLHGPAQRRRHDSRAM